MFAIRRVMKKNISYPKCQEECYRCVVAGIQENFINTWVISLLETAYIRVVLEYMTLSLILEDNKIFIQIVIFEVMIKREKRVQNIFHLLFFCRNKMSATRYSACSMPDLMIQIISFHNKFGSNNLLVWITGYIYW